MGDLLILRLGLLLFSIGDRLRLRLLAGGDRLRILGGGDRLGLLLSIGDRLRFRLIILGGGDLLRLGDFLFGR